MNDNGRPWRVAVIGSGAAGVSCATALAEQGAEVTIFDGGERLEASKVDFVRHLAALRPTAWTETDRLLFGETKANAKGIPLKFAYGSNFPFRDPRKTVELHQERTELLYSLAEGGLTTVWGANTLPWKASDFSNWPFHLSELEDHYRAVLKFMPLAGKTDDLALDYPLYHEHPKPLNPSHQARELLEDLERQRDQLRQVGVTFGGSRLAIQAAEIDDPLSGCEYCGECLFGCVYSHIYSAAHTLQDLVANRGVRHQSGACVEKISETPNGVLLTCLADTNGQPHELEFNRVFVAAGVIPTARLVLHSRKLYNVPIPLKDSRYFIVPFLRWKGVRNVRAQATHTLSQIFLEMNDPKISSRGVHLQFYSYTHIYEEVVRKFFPQLSCMFPWAVEAFLSRLFIVQGYLHSDDSSTMTLSLEGNGKVVHLKVAREANEKSIVRAALRKLIRQFSAFRGLPVTPRLEIAPSGKSYHCGGSFPMASSPGPLQTDRLGRLGGTGRIHLVDASVIPDIAATSITLTVMANAHRIAHEVARDLAR